MESILEFNQQIRHVLDAGVPVSLSGESSVSATKRKLDQLDARVGCQTSFQDAQVYLAQEPLVDDIYRLAFSQWLQTGDFGKAADVLQEFRVLESEVRWGMTRLLLPMLIIVVLALPAFWYLQEVIYPKLKSFYDDVSLESGWTLKTMSWLNDNNFVGTWLLPLCIVVLVLCLLTPISLARWSPGVSMTLASRKRALAYSMGAKQTAASQRVRDWVGYMTNENASFAMFFWYRLIPTIVGVVLAGGVILFYALVSFGSLMELILRLSEPGARL